MPVKQIATFIAVVVPFGIPLLLTIAFFCTIKNRYFSTRVV